MQSNLFSGLEARTFLSGSHVGENPKPTGNLEADRAAILADVTKFKADVETARGVIATAVQTQKTHAASLAAQISVLNAETTKDTNSLKAITTGGDLETKALRVKWSAILGPEELDVKTNSEGESETERAADVAKLTADRQAAQAQLASLQEHSKAATASLQAELTSDRAAVEALRKSAGAQTAADAKVIAAAVKSLQTIFQSDKLVVDTAISLYKSHGGKMDGFVLPALPKL